MKTILRKVVKNNFTIVSNEMIQNPDMSNKARGLYVYMLSMPDDWQFCVADLMNRSTDGRDSIKSQLNELERIGYIKRGQETNADGTFGHAYVLVRSSMDLPWPDEPLTENPLTVNPLTENPLQQSTHSTKDTESKNPTTNVTLSRSQEISEIWDAYVQSIEDFKRRTGKKVRVRKLSQPYRDLIDLRLRDGYTVEEVKLAMTGWVHSPHHTGDKPDSNPEGKVYCSPDLLLRHNKIDQFIEYHDTRKPTRPGNVNDAHGRERRASSDIIELDDDEDFIDD
jgi:Helix-turn-helix domain